MNSKIYIIRKRFKLPVYDCKICHALEVVLIRNLQRGNIEKAEWILQKLERHIKWAHRKNEAELPPKIKRRLLEISLKLINPPNKSVLMAVQNEQKI